MSLFPVVASLSRYGQKNHAEKRKERPQKKERTNQRTDEPAMRHFITFQIRYFINPNAFPTHLFPSSKILYHIEPALWLPLKGRPFLGPKKRKPIALRCSIFTCFSGSDEV